MSQFDSSLNIENNPDQSICPIKVGLDIDTIPHIISGLRDKISETELPTLVEAIERSLNNLLEVEKELSNPDSISNKIILKSRELIKLWAEDDAVSIKDQTIRLVMDLVVLAGNSVIRSVGPFGDYNII